MNCPECGSELSYVMTIVTTTLWECRTCYQEYFLQADGTLVSIFYREPPTSDQQTTPKENA